MGPMGSVGVYGTAVCDLRETKGSRGCGPIPMGWQCHIYGDLKCSRSCGPKAMGCAFHSGTAVPDLWETKGSRGCGPIPKGNG